MPRFGDAPWQTGPTPALIAGPTHWDYSELTDRARRRAAVLRDLGLSPGRLVVCPVGPPMARGPELVLMQHALARTGAALLPVRPDLTPAQQRRLIASTGAEWIWQPAAAGAGDGGRLIPTGQELTGTDGWDDPLALVVQTSGSSGNPKAAMLTERGVLSSCALVNARLGLRQGDVWLGCLPRQHVGGLAIGYRCALAGAAMRMHDGFDAAAVRDDLDRHAVTHLSLVPPMLVRLLALDPRPPAALRVLLLGGQALDAGLAREAADAGWPLVVGYGMTETFTLIASAGSPTAVAGGDAAGPCVPLPGVELACGACGETPRRLQTRAPMVMAGYANPERQPGDGLNGRWLETNDLGCLDSNGHLRVLGRADEVLVIGGVNVLPAPIEQRIGQIAGVDEVAVVGIADAVWGHRLAAVYVGAISELELAAWCRASLPGPERPRLLLRVAELPVLGSGKRDRRRIEAMVAAATAR